MSFNKSRSTADSLSKYNCVNVCFCTNSKECKHPYMHREMFMKAWVKTLFGSTTHMMCCEHVFSA